MEGEENINVICTPRVSTNCIDNRQCVLKYCKNGGGGDLKIFPC